MLATTSTVHARLPKVQKDGTIFILGQKDGTVQFLYWDKRGPFKLF